MSPHISFFALAYNSAKWIQETISSFYTQGTEDFEIVIVDDASTDETPAAVHPFLSDPRVRYLRLRHNQGIGRSLPFALDQLRGDIFCGLGGDDSLEPGHTAIVTELFSKFPEASVATTRLKTVGSDGCEKPSASGAAVTPDFPEYLDATSALRATLQHNIIAGPGACFRGNITRRILPFFGSSWRFCNDWFLMMLHFSTGFGLATSQEKTVRYRVHNASLSRRADLNATRAVETRLSPLAGLRFSSPWSRDAAILWQQYSRALYALWLLRATKWYLNGKLPMDYIYLARSLYYGGPPRTMPFLLEALVHFPAISAAYWRERRCAKNQPFPCCGLRQVDHPIFRNNVSSE